MIENGALIDVVDKYGQTALHFAAKKGYINIVKLLVDKGAIIDAKDSQYSVTPLHVAATVGHVEIVEYFLANGATIDIKNKNNQTPLHFAVREGHLEIVKRLIENGAAINEKESKYGYTALYIAAKNGHLKIAKFLIKNGAQIDSSDNENCAPLVIAIKKGHLDVADFLSETKKRKAENVPEEILSSKDPCVVCLEPRNELYVLLPCGHTSLCESCCIKVIYKENHSKCPTCRKTIKSYNKIFFQKPV